MFASSCLSCWGEWVGRLGDECPHFCTFQKYSLSVRNEAARAQTEGKLPFSLTCSQGWGSEWGAIRERLPSEVMNTVQIRRRGLSISSALAFRTHCSKSFSIFCSTAHSCFSLSLSLSLPSFFGQIFIFFNSPSVSPVVYMLHERVGWQGELWEVERAKAELAGCGTESWDSTAFGENAACSRNRKAVWSHRRPWPWFVRGGGRNDLNPWSRRPRRVWCMHMVSASKWISQSSSWIIVREQNIIEKHW